MIEIVLKITAIFVFVAVVLPILIAVSMKVFDIVCERLGM